jgi:thioredoxin-dependent peroxiredoxin
MLQVGAKVPNFSLASNAGTISAAGLKGARYVLYFYPKDDTPGCTKEACGFRDLLPRFDGSKIKIFGVSADSIAAHEKFAAKFALNFPLLSDPERKLIEGLGVWVEKSMYGKKYMGIARASFVIDAQGVIEKVWEKVSVETHAAEVLAYLSGAPEAKPGMAKPSAAKPGTAAVSAKKTVAKTPASKPAAPKKTAVAKVATKRPAAKSKKP